VAPFTACWKPFSHHLKSRAKPDEPLFAAPTNPSCSIIAASVFGGKQRHLKVPSSDQHHQIVDTAVLHADGSLQIVSRTITDDGIARLPPVVSHEKVNVVAVDLALKQVGNCCRNASMMGSGISRVILRTSAVSH
jgi:hypothetical protein